MNVFVQIVQGFAAGVVKGGDEKHDRRGGETGKH